MWLVSEMVIKGWGEDTLGGGVLYAWGNSVKDGWW